jgi:large subunit ribosomal protein L32
MPNPRRRHSRKRRDKRRTGDALALPKTVECPQCHEPKLPHTVCKACGTYDGKRVLNVEEA